MKKLKLISLVMVFSLGVIIFAGCGNGEADNGEADKEDPKEKDMEQAMELPEFEEMRPELENEVTMQKIQEEIITPRLDDWKEELNVKKGEEAGEGIAAMVNEVEITEEEVEEELEYMQQQGMMPPDEDQEGMRDDVIENLVFREVLLQKALEDDIEVEDEAIKEQMDQIEAQIEMQFGGQKEFKEILEQDGLTKEELEEQIADDLKISNFIESFEDEVEVTEEELKEVYEDYKKEIEMQQQMMEDKEKMMEKELEMEKEMKEKDLEK